jgi:hypothetical protein
LRIPELFLGCLLTVAVFAIGMIFLKEGDWLTKDAAGFFTFALVIVGALQAALFFVQLKFIRESLGPAKEAAKAAQAAAEALPTVERAYVFMVPTMNSGPPLLTVRGWVNVTIGSASSLESKISGKHQRRLTAFMLGLRCCRNLRTTEHI